MDSQYPARILGWMVNLWIERFRPTSLLRKELRDSSLGTEEDGRTQQAIQPHGASCHGFQTNPEQTGSFGFGAQGIAPPPRILFR
jgi:hypothetical protein